MKNYKSIFMAIMLGLGLSQVAPVFSTGSNSAKKILNIFGPGASEGKGWWIDVLTKKVLGEGFVNKHPKITVGLVLGAASVAVLGTIVLFNWLCRKEDEQKEENEKKSGIAPRNGGWYED